MRRILLITLAVGLAGCGDADVSEAPPAEVDHGAQEQACADAVAAHTGLPFEAMAPEWTGITDTGTDIVFVHHGATLHTCEVDAEGRVLELQHPVE